MPPTSRTEPTYPFHPRARNFSFYRRDFLLPFDLSAAEISTIHSVSLVYRVEGEEEKRAGEMRARIAANYITDARNPLLHTSLLHIVREIIFVRRWEARRLSPVSFFFSSPHYPALVSQLPRIISFPRVQESLQDTTYTLIHAETLFSLATCRTMDNRTPKPLRGLQNSTALL